MKKEDFIQDREAKESKEKKRRWDEQVRKDISNEAEKKVRRKRQTEENLAYLKEMVKQGDIDQKIAQIVQSTITEDVITIEVKDILEKIDEMNKSKEIHHYLPEELRVTKDEYIQAQKDEKKRKEVLAKIEEALSHIGAHIWVGKKLGCNMVALLALLFNKNLVFLQENHIDMKDNLKALKG